MHSGLDDVASPSLLALTNHAFSKAVGLRNASCGCGAAPAVLRCGADQIVCIIAIEGLDLAQDPTHCCLNASTVCSTNLVAEG